MINSLLTVTIFSAIMFVLFIVIDRVVDFQEEGVYNLITFFGGTLFITLIVWIFLFAYNVSKLIMGVC